ncbi:hypothetical protein [Bacillus pumilus]|uniref:hypothetical protein n=1 Tax=Bacillus pumilus TaxID=1408 RepID=UPI0007EEC4C2|nr:hypothetical protein [Bacillus pumilus]OBS85760.1 hypothetical protein BAY68_19265 [Bacillus pumilus]
MIDFYPRQTPPYNDKPVKTSLENLQVDLANLYDTVSKIDISDELMQGLDDLKEKVRLIEATLSGDDSGASDNAITALQREVETFGGVLDAHLSDTVKHVTASERTKWTNSADSIQGLTDSINTHASDGIIHVTAAERVKWNDGQLFKLTPDNGQVKRLPNGTDIFTLGTGFYMGANLINVPIEDGSFYYVQILETEYVTSNNRYRQMLVTRSYDNRTWCGTVHAQGFRGWKEFMTDMDVNLFDWKDLTIVNVGFAVDAQSKPQYAYKNGVLYFRGYVGSNDYNSHISILSSFRPSRALQTNATLVGTTGITKLRLEPSGHLYLIGKHAKTESAVEYTSLDGIALPL